MSLGESVVMCFTELLWWLLAGNFMVDGLKHSLFGMHYIFRYSGPSLMQLPWCSSF